jgi:tetratricopeptide (TPR) repeat protein
LRIFHQAFNHKPLAIFQKPGVYLFLVLVVTCAAFYPSLDNGFIHWDDKPHLLENPTVMTLDGPHLIRHFTSTVNNTYIPLTTLSFALEYSLVGANPFVYHLDNLLLHLTVVALVFWLGGLWGLSLPGRMLAALLFGIHPMHVESVVWVTERKDVLYAVFYLLAVVNYCRYLQHNKRKAYWLAVVCGFLSILAKPMAISLPLILLICDWFLQRQGNRNAFLDKWPFVLIAGGVGLITLSLHARVSLQDFWQGMHIFVWSATFYVKKFFIPDFFTPLYDWPLPVSLNNPVYQTAYGLVLMYAGLLFLLRRNRLFVLATAYYLASSFFLFRFDLADVNVVADRFMYLPSLGYCYFIGETLCRWVNKTGSLRLFKAMLVTALFVGFGFKTFAQVDIWQDSLRLWNYTLRYNPRSIHAYLYRAESYNALGQYDLAIEDCNRVLYADPHNFLAYYTRAMSFSQKGEVFNALKDFEIAQAINPVFQDIYLNRGVLFLMTSNWKDAIADFSEVLAAQPFHFRALNYRATAYSFLGESTLALKDFDAAVKIYPRFKDVYVNRGTFWAIQQKYDLAIADFTRAIALDPKDPALFLNRSRAYQDSGQEAKALEDAQAAKQLLSPTPGESRDNLQ